MDSRCVAVNPIGTELAAQSIQGIEMNGSSSLAVGGLVLAL